MTRSAIAPALGLLLLAATPAYADTACRPGKKTFDQVFEGMPYQVVLGMFGCLGDLKSSSLVQGQKTEIFEWNGSGKPDARISAVFVNNVMVMKSAYGLE
jgi:hypothetical protein